MVEIKAGDKSCPNCKEPAEQIDQAAFVEIGEYDEASGKYAGEGEVGVWLCRNKNCNTEFYI